MNTLGILYKISDTNLNANCDPKKLSSETCIIYSTFLFNNSQNFHWLKYVFMFRRKLSIGSSYTKHITISFILNI